MRRLDLTRAVALPALCGAMTMLAACGGGGGAAASASAAASAPTTAKSAAPAKASAAPKPTAAAELEEVDLSSRGDEWKGFTIRAPKSAKIMDDLGDCRIAEKGFDVVLSQKKERSDVAARKKDLEGLAKTLKGKVTFSNETADGFDYKLETPKYDKPDELIARDDFFVVVKAGKGQVGCFPHTSAMGDEIVKAREACKTVQKK
jgi:hypothetical protein